MARYYVRFYNTQDTPRKVLDGVVSAKRVARGETVYGLGRAKYPGWDVQLRSGVRTLVTQLIQEGVQAHYCSKHWGPGGCRTVYEADDGEMVEAQSDVVLFGPLPHRRSKVQRSASRTRSSRRWQRDFMDLDVPDKDL